MGLYDIYPYLIDFKAGIQVVFYMGYLKISVPTAPFANKITGNSMVNFFNLTIN